MESRWRQLVAEMGWSQSEVGLMARNRNAANQIYGKNPPWVAPVGGLYIDQGPVLGCIYIGPIPLPSPKPSFPFGFEMLPDDPV